MIPYRSFLHITHFPEHVPFFPSVVLLAGVSALFEGIIFRCGLLGVLKEFMPEQDAVLAAGAVFGAAHFYGAPSEVLGAAASLLGWFLGRSVYETRGLLASRIIHGGWSGYHHIFFFPAVISLTESTTRRSALLQG